MLERVFVWTHVLVILGFLAYLPYSKHLHIGTAAVNVFFGRTRARGRLEPLDFASEDEAALRFGAGTVADLTWKQMPSTRGVSLRRLNGAYWDHAQATGGRKPQPRGRGGGEIEVRCRGRRGRGRSPAR